MLDTEVQDSIALTGFAHDIRNAIGLGRTSLDLLDDAGDEAECDQLKGVIRNALERAERLLHDLLDANRLRAGRAFPVKSRQRLDVKMFLGELVRELNADPRLNLVLDCSENLVAYWSAEDVRRVLENLIGNAQKYRRGGPITLSCERRGDEVTLRVHNEGRVAPGKLNDGLFTLFARGGAPVERGAEGWGVGLTLVKGITEALGGRVRVTSELEAGTMFEVRLPS